MITIGLQKDSQEPIYEQIYKYIRDEIKAGSLEKNSKLPSSRGLAAHLMVSRNTVDMAYSQLLSEGYIESFPKRGYFVCEIEEVFSVGQILEDDVVEEEQKADSYEIDFSPSGVDMANFPYNKWRKLMREVMIDDNSEIFQIGHPQGDLELRKRIRLYLHQSRGVNCHENQIVIGAGSDYLLLLLGQIFGHDQVVGLEDPIYPQAYRVFQSLGYQTKSIELDKYGISVESLTKANADIAYVTPSHQYPTGIVMPINRRLQLLSWASMKAGRYIIEDDYDSEFRYQGRPIPSLQGQDTKGNVIYIGTFSKGIAPAIRISYMVLPQALLKTFRERLSFYSSTVSRIDQAVIRRFIEEGDYERHLNRMRGIYKNKHDHLIQCLKGFQDKIKILGASSGLHLLVQYNGKLTEEQLVKKAKQRGIKVYPLSLYYRKQQTIQKPQIILGFARLSEAEIEKGIAALTEVW